MFTPRSPHLKAVLQALFVSFLWSTSWVLIKIGLEDIPALTFAGLRYSLAFLILLPFALRKGQMAVLQGLSRRDWVWLSALGILFYSITQGAQFLALTSLPAVTLSLLLNFSAVVVAFMGIVLLSEYLSRLQWIGTGLFLVGVVLYFYPIAIPAGEGLGLIIGFIGVLANAGSAVLGRYVNRGQRLPALTVTLVSMGVGATLLMITGLITQGFPVLSLTSWLIILWLAAVNTSLAFTLWNVTLRTLPAVESSIINNTMLVQIAILAWLFLDETIAPLEGFGLVLAAIGILMVQIRRQSSE
jgi:drug/metabolite transporter (DMT)-like permease